LESIISCIVRPGFILDEVKNELLFLLDFSAVVAVALYLFLNSSRLLSLGLNGDRALLKVVFAVVIGYILSIARLIPLSCKTDFCMSILRGDGFAILLDLA